MVAWTNGAAITYKQYSNPVIKIGSPLGFKSTYTTSDQGRHVGHHWEKNDSSWIVQRVISLDIQNLGTANKWQLSPLALLLVGSDGTSVFLLLHHLAGLLKSGVSQDLLCRRPPHRIRIHHGLKNRQNRIFRIIFSRPQLWKIKVYALQYACKVRMPECV